MASPVTIIRDGHVLTPDEVDSEHSRCEGRPAVGYAADIARGGILIGVRQAEPIVESQLQEEPRP
ncbi:MAG TPA: hypothetical protein VIJ51_01710 [Solirubrobacteraceae bacterium]